MIFNRYKLPLVGWSTLLLILLIGSLFLNKEWHITIFNQVAITIIFAISYNQLLGQTGLLSLGHSIFMGIGGYFSALIILKVNQGLIFLPLPFLPFVGGVAGMTLAAIVGSFAVKKSGMIFAILSLSVLELISSFSISFPSVLGGLLIDRTLNTSFLNYDFTDKKSIYFVTVFWLFFVLLIAYYFLQTPLGRMCNAARENSSRIEYIGYSNYLIRYLSFCFSGFLAGIAGTLFVLNYEMFSSELFSLRESFNILCATYIGGIGYFFGPIIGAAIFSIFGMALMRGTELWSLYQGILLMMFVMFLPRGIAGFLIDQKTVLKKNGIQTTFIVYLKISFSLILFVLSVSWLVETLNIILHHKDQSHFTFFWVSSSVYNFWNWLFAIIITIGSLFTLRLILKYNWI